MNAKAVEDANKKKKNAEETMKYAEGIDDAEQVNDNNNRVEMNEATRDI